MREKKKTDTKERVNREGHRAMLGGKRENGEIFHLVFGESIIDKIYYF